MATASTSPQVAAFPSRVFAGAIGGLVGGLIFGVLMHMMHMMGMVAMLVNSDAVAVGWLVHLAISVFVGVSFAVLFSRLATSVLSSTLIGAGYGIVWWVLGGLILMPARLGMDLFMFNTTAWQSLMGHVIYGVLLGLVYGLIQPHLHRS